MPKTNLPSYRLHKPSGQAIVVLKGKTFYLGEYKSKASREKYNDLIADYLANDKKLPPLRSADTLTIQAAVIKFLEHAEKFYVKNGKRTATFTNYRESLSHIIRWYGHKAVSDFGPVALQFVRDKLIDAGYVRKTINDRVSCIVCFFQWLAANEHCRVDIYNMLKAVPRLKKGQAPDNPKVPPVPEAIVNATLPYLPPIIADMVRVQLFIGGRPQDVCNMRVMDFEQTGKVWTYRPFTHKNAHRDQTLIKAVGPQAQEILRPYLERKGATPEAFLFSPADTLQMKREERRTKRKTKIQPSQLNRRKTNPQWTPKGYYTHGSYSQAVERAIVKYNTAEKIAAEKEGRKPVELPHWTPNQLRHTAGTKTAALFTVEAAKEYLGHSRTSTTEQYYVAPLPELAVKVALEIG